MAFARGFSLRRARPDNIETQPPTPALGRAASQRGGRPVVRAMISSPTALISTTNSQVMHAPSIAGRSPIEIRKISSSAHSTTSSRSSNDSDAGTGSIHSNEDTITDASSVDENSPLRTEPEPNHLTSYFKPAVDTRTSTTASTEASPVVTPGLESTDTTPRLPQRAPSHSKRAHEGLHRKRSIQRLLSPPPSRGTSTHEVARNSADIFSPTTATSTSVISSPPSAFTPVLETVPSGSSTTSSRTEKENPFGRELAQLDEIAEEFGAVVKTAEAEADAKVLASRGLGRFNAAEYMFEIQSLVRDMFWADHPIQRIGAHAPTAIVGNFF